MTWKRLKWIAVSILALLLLAFAGAYYALSDALSDRYIGQPQVVGLPPGYDPLAAASPYAGVHPSRKDRQPDPFTYPVTIGSPGPVTPTYADSLD